MKQYFLIACITFFMYGCAGLFATDDRLADLYPFVASDSDVAIFYDKGATSMAVAVKNIGNAFITGLSVSFTCTEINKTDTQIYAIGNLKTYFNKKLTVPMVYNDCRTLVFEYSFIPTADAGFIYGDNINGFQNTPGNPITGIISLK